MKPDTPPAGADAFGLSLVRDDLLFRLQRRVGLIPAGGLGVVRRAVFWSMLAWLPIVAWAWYRGRVGVPPVDESLLAHYGVHARFLVAVPLFIVAEGMAHAFTTKLLPYFVTSGLVPEAALPAFRQALADTARLRNATLPWIAILAIVIGVLTAATITGDVHEINWAVEGEGSATHPGFGAWWLLYVGRGIYLTLMLGWLWRVVLFLMLFRKISKLGLSIVPTHPDRNGGLGFLARFPVVFAPVVFAIAAVLASGWAHDVVYHQLSVRDLKWEMLAFVVVVLAVFLSPVAVFAKTLSSAKKRALLEYGALVGRHGRLVRERWIEGREVKDDAVLGAPELGPVADTVAMYEAVARMRPLLVSKQSVAPLVVAALVPMLAVLSLQIPVVELVKRLVGALL
jgi:hypothetical protein